jgi:hypothetical protein
VPQQACQLAARLASPLAACPALLQQEVPLPPRAAVRQAQAAQALVLRLVLVAVLRLVLLAVLARHRAQPSRQLKRGPAVQLWRE